MKIKLKDELQYHIKKVSITMWVIIAVVMTVIITLRVYEYEKRRESFNQTVSSTLSKFLLENDLVQIKNISNGLTKTNSSFDLCLKYKGQLIYGSRCDNRTDYEAYNIPLRENKLYISSRLKNKFQEYLIIVPFLIPVFLIFMLISRQINKHCSLIEQDLLNLTDLENKENFHFDEFSTTKSQLNELEEIKENSLKLEVANKISKQVAHDIQSPLAALEIVMEDIKNLPEESRDLTVHAINRIQEIANNLSKDGKSATEVVATDCLPSITVANILNEKTIEYQNRNGVKLSYIDKTTKRSFVKINESELARVISNLINNAAEGLSDFNGDIQVTLLQDSEFVTINIEDSGLGFPKDILENGISEGKTIGKKNGQGLGLHYAKTIVEKYAGELKLSNQSSGARVEIKLPMSQTPKWFRDSLEISKYEELLIIDDDRSIHDVWKKLIRPIHSSIKIKSAFFEADILNELEKLKPSSLVLLDYDLRQKYSGIELIKKYQIKNVSLVSSNYDTAEVISFCESNNIQLIPKQIVSSIHLK